MRKDRILDKLGEMEVDGNWKWFHTNRYGKELMLELVRYRIDIFRDFEIDEEEARFRKIYPYKAPQDKQITIKLEWREDTGQVTDKELNLPDPKLKYVDHKQWEKLKGRAT